MHFVSKIFMEIKETAGRKDPMDGWLKAPLSKKKEFVGHTFCSIDLIKMLIYPGVCVCARLLIMSDWAAPWTVACQFPLSMEFFSQEYWSGLPFPPPGNLPNPGIKPWSPASPELAGKFFTTEPPEKHLLYTHIRIYFFRLFFHYRL